MGSQGQKWAGVTTGGTLTFFRVATDDAALSAVHSERLAPLGLSSLAVTKDEVGHLGMFLIRPSSDSSLLIGEDGKSFISGTLVCGK